MFERFDHDGREAVVMAQHEARALSHHYIGTEHLLLGVLHGSGSGARVLRRLGIELEVVRGDVVRIIGMGPSEGLPADDAEALRSIGIDLDEVRRRVEAAFGPGALDHEMRSRRRRRRGRCETVVGGHIPFTPRAKKVLELSLREAVRLGHDFIGTGHEVLAMLREGEGMAAKILSDRGPNPDVIRRLLIEEVGGAGSLPGRSA